MDKPSLFNSNCTDGVVELYFSEEEVLNLVELLTMTKEICENAAYGDNSTMSQDQKDVFREKAESATLLLEKIISDASPGVPRGDLH